MSNGGSPQISRLVIASLLMVSLFAVLSWLQGRFDTSDHRKATTIVTDYRAEAGPRLVDAILARHPGIGEPEVSWTSEITSGCLGHVRVSALVPARDGRPSATYAFDVNLTGPSVHPTDERTVEILRGLTATSSAAQLGE